MARSIKVIVYPVKDINQAKVFYGTYLGVDPYVDSPYYVGYKTNDTEVGLDPNSNTGPIGYIDVDDISRCLNEMKNVGAEIVQDAKEVGAGLLIAQVKDADGNIVGFRQQPKQ